MVSRKTGVDWTQIDWAKNDYQLAGELGCTRSTVQRHRQYAGAPPSTDARERRQRLLDQYTLLPQERVLEGWLKAGGLRADGFTPQDWLGAASALARRS